MVVLFLNLKNVITGEFVFWTITATVALPKATNKKITEESQDLRKSEDIKHIQQSGKDVTLTIGSGQYSFSYPMEVAAEKGNESDKLSIDSSLAKLIANKRTGNLLKQHLTNLMHSLWLSQVMGFSFERAEKVLSDKLQVSSSQISKIYNEL